MMEALDARAASRHAGGPALRARAEGATSSAAPATANPLLARLARRFDCPVHGARAIRLPGGRFRLELTRGDRRCRATPRDWWTWTRATQAMNDIVEGWIREHPGQWLWQHRRWR